jgi:protocatechuate 3,4-dioxygenase beta subunit
VDVAAAVCAVEVGRATAPAALVASTSAAAVGGSISPAVAGLVKGGLGPGVTTKVQQAAALALLAVSLTIGTAGLRGLGRTEAVGPPEQDKRAVAPPEVPMAPQAAKLPRYAVTVSGTVTDSDGKPVAGAHVYLTVSNRILEKPLPTTRTDAQGHYAFRDVPLPTILAINVNGKPNLTLQVCGTAEEFAFDWKTLPFVEILPVPPPSAQAGQPAFTAVPQICDLKFGPPAHFRGKIVDDGGRPIVGAKVSIDMCNRLVTKPAGGRLTSIDNIFRSGDVIPGETTVTTGRDGRFRLDGLPKNVIARIPVEHRDFPSAQLTAATNAIEPRVPSIVIPFLPRGGTGEIWTEDINLVLTRPRDFPVRVVSSLTLKPVPGADVWLLSQGKVVLSDARLTDGKGEVTVRMPPGDHTLHAVSPRGLPRRVPAAGEVYYVRSQEAVVIKADLAEQPRIVSLVPCCAIHAEVVDADNGKPVADSLLTVSLEREGNVPARIGGRGPAGGRGPNPAGLEAGWERVEERGSAPTPQTDAHGRATIWAPPGRARIRVAIPPPAPYEVYTTCEPITLEAGRELRLRFELRKRQ